MTSSLRNALDRRMELLGSGHPNLGRCRQAESQLVLAQQNGHGAVVISGLDLDHGAGKNSFTIEKFQQFAVAFVNAPDLVLLALLGLAEQAKAVLAPLRIAAHAQAVTVGTYFLVPELGHQFLFKRRRDGVFKPLGLVMDSVPGQIEDLGKHALDQMVAEDSAVGDAPSLWRELDLGVLCDLDQAI